MIIFGDLTIDPPLLLTTLSIMIEFTSLLSSRSEQNTTMNDLFNHLFIELWNKMINFTGYFKVCSPHHSCTYSYDR
ncbi:unnamed protein product [Rotaria sordida]|uniref:Uncharacterized protein n=1 Tax=Rotaria sordida TaxID=392033 RepID=A0A819MQ02_9BILA|nr:unnamed protein product [Rotaria sordida]CAF4007234.1 unnamed protein product [Rotaria sordida]